MGHRVRHLCHYTTPGCIGSWRRAYKWEGRHECREFVRWDASCAVVLTPRNGDHIETVFDPTRKSIEQTTWPHVDIALYVNLWIACSLRSYHSHENEKMLRHGLCDRSYGLQHLRRTSPIVVQTAVELGNDVYSQKSMYNSFRTTECLLSFAHDKSARNKPVTTCT